MTTQAVLRVAAVALAAAAASSCAGGGQTRDGETAVGDTAGGADGDAERGRLGARPGEPTAEAPRGLHELAHGALLYVPRGYRGDRRHPFVLTLHGAGGAARNGLGPLLPLADDLGVILLAPKSRHGTWDVLVRGFGPDVTAIDELLAATFERCAVDAKRLAVAGFSDGASYALSLGLTNGDLFTDVLAFSPGFSAAEALRGRPRVFISHGTADPVLGIERTSRRIVPSLRERGFDVDYREFEGGHTVPTVLARAALESFVGSG